MGPDQFLTIDTVEDVMNFRVNLPAFGARDLGLTDQERMRNACLKLMSTEYGRKPQDLAQFLGKQLTTLSGSQSKRWSGFKVDDEPWGVKFCGAAIESGQQVDPGTLQIELVSGLFDDVIISRRAVLTDEGWSTVFGTTDFHSITSLNYWYLPATSRIAALPKTVVAAIARDRWQIQKAVSRLSIDVPTGEILFASDSLRVTRDGNTTVYVRVGSRELFDHFKSNAFDANPVAAQSPTRRSFPTHLHFQASGASRIPGSTGSLFETRRLQRLSEWSFPWNHA
jgi:hypothetical protein